MHMYHVLVVFNFSLEDRIVQFLVIAYLLHNVTVFWSIKAFSEFMEEYNVAGVY